MKPLSSFIYIKNNVKKVIVSFICTILSVLLIYLFGLILFSSLESWNKIGVNLFNNSTSIQSNGEQISPEIIDMIRSDENVKDIIPILGTNNYFRYNDIFGNGSMYTYIIYSEDIEKVMENYNIKLIEGRIPHNNEHEILLPIELAKQYKLKIGDIITNDTNSQIKVDKEYKLVGITKGNIWLPIISDVGTTERDECIKYGMLFFLKDESDKSINNRLDSLENKNFVTHHYQETKTEMEGIVMSLNILYISLSSIIIIVLSISLGNLNYIIFMNRENEFSILKAIGHSNRKLRNKLLKENIIVCFLGYIVGIIVTTFINLLLNITIFYPNGQHLLVFRLESLIVALIVPIATSILSMITVIKSLNKLSYETLNI